MERKGAYDIFIQNIPESMYTEKGEEKEDLLCDDDISKQKGKMD